MEQRKTHWTAKSLADFLFRVGADFVYQVECKLGSQKDLAGKLGISEGAVSQTLNSPGNLKLQTMIQYARALGMKLSVVLYNDDDLNNERGPVHADIFRLCWEKAGRPTDFAAFATAEPMRVALSNEGSLKKHNGSYEYKNETRMTINIYKPISAPLRPDTAVNAGLISELGASVQGG